MVNIMLMHIFNFGVFCLNFAYLYCKFIAVYNIHYYLKCCDLLVFVFLPLFGLDCMNNTSNATEAKRLGYYSSTK